LSLWRPFIIALCAALFFGVLARSIFVVLFFFTWFFGMHFLFAIIRHYRWLKKIVSKLESPPAANLP
jgi:hypothetical protein